MGAVILQAPLHFSPRPSLCSQVAVTLLRLHGHGVAIVVLDAGPGISVSLWSSPSLPSHTAPFLCTRGYTGYSSRNRKINQKLHRPSFHMVRNYLHSGWDLLLY